jgi:hypothetical protein
MWSYRLCLQVGVVRTWSAAAQLTLTGLCDGPPPCDMSAPLKAWHIKSKEPRSAHSPSAPNPDGRAIVVRQPAI